MQKATNEMSDQNDQNKDDQDKEKEVVVAEISQQPEAEEKTTAPAENKKKPDQAADKKPSKISARLIIGVLVLILLGVACAAGFVFIQQEKQQIEQQTIELQNQLTQTQTALAQLQAQQQDLGVEYTQNQNALNQRLLLAEQRLQAQHKRLQSLSTTSREDWLLAEAEYLLRLANQRVLIERSPRSADGLLTEADEILKNLDDPDLFPLRQAIANDLAQLRLVEQVDHEGIYFALKALIEQVDKLSLRPTRQQLMGVNKQETVAQELEPETQEVPVEKSLWKKIADATVETFAFMSGFIKYTDHSERPPPLLPPDSASYLQQNLRFKIERAQLALLREEQSIYESSLNEALEWLRTWYPKSTSTEAYINQLDALRQKQIVQQLPDITYSLELLHDYIETLHKLEGVNLPGKEGNLPTDSEGATL